MSFTPGVDEANVRDRLDRCITALRVWMSLNKLKLNDKKTEFIVFGSSPGQENRHNIIKGWTRSYPSSDRGPEHRGLL